MNIFLLLLSLIVFPVLADSPALEMHIDGKNGIYQAPDKATRPWRICALLPHGKDHYWWGVAWGLSQEAERLGVEIGIYNAGGYDKLEVQQQQLRDCHKLKADAYIIAAISADGLNEQAALLMADGIPVIDLVNGMSTDKVSSRSLVQFSDMVRAAVEFMLSQTAAKTRQIELGWFPGPEGAAWVMDAEIGLKKTIVDQAIQLHHGGYGVTETFVQANLVRNMVAERHPDYIIANAVAASIASKYFIDGKRGNTKVISFYSNPQTIELVRDGRLQATVTDSPVLQARVAVDLTVQWLEQGSAPRLVSPVIQVLTSENLAEADLSLTLPPEHQWMIHQDLSPIGGATALQRRNQLQEPKTD
ncbi:TMAO reductase system periplasmic protein TorT [Shewanella litorisediminis]|uniref:TMAO reductase system periplasmic protein TorT n=1 Tax=Shewanella litorisediminis TaxID=1173586 RepID=A0ABX7G4Q1_9GAMM|nr:TMAO reductase system periplasmic protein TorT [Shewanella litorisediminis]MCL2917782.1 TMAO reductase system periplasmic protein TorT [Shewanella litorisediminis]QRH02225.1 TMAO reductase system periplasmic protein TorT [Shewanella litorisediminis]